MFLSCLVTLGEARAVWGVCWHYRIVKMSYFSNIKPQSKCSLILVVLCEGNNELLSVEQKGAFDSIYGKTP